MLDMFKRKPDGGERSWSERLKSGLGLSRERISRPLTALFGREALSEEAVDELRSALREPTSAFRRPSTCSTSSSPAGSARADLDARAVLKSALVELIAPPSSRSSSARRAFRHHARRGQRCGQDDVDRQAGQVSAGQTSVRSPQAIPSARRASSSKPGVRNNVQVVAQHGGDPAAVMFDAISAARARRIDVVLADTAGRLPTQLPLMEELKKIRRVIAKAQEGAPHETLLVLDANTGQNALAQVAAFDAALGLTGLVLTKLDGTAKGGVVAAIAKTRPVPLKLIGVGEGIDDLRPFRAAEFADALIG
jgi:fused signal recognition particle receptor